MKIAVMGPKDSIHNFFQSQKGTLTDLDFIPLEAHTLKESKDKISTLNGSYSGILFTGRSVYDSVKEEIPKGISFEYVPHNESSIFSLLMEHPLNKISTISIDLIDKQIIEESLKYSKITEFYTLPHKDGYTEKDYICFHEENISSKKADAVFTTFSPIYDYFKDKGVPVYRLYTTNFAIRNSVNKLINKINSSIIDKSKIAVQTVEVLCDKENLSKIELLNIVLKFQESMIPYLKIIQGSLFSNGWNEFIIFSTKGAISTHHAKTEFHKILEKEKNKVFSGIGLGITAAEAELNAIQALKYSRDYNQSSFYFMSSDKRVEGPIGFSNCLSLNNKITSSEMDEIVAKTKLSHAYIDKLISIKALYKIDSFSSEEMSEYLGISSRSSRRIIKKLIDGGYARIIGKEGRGSSGRPLNIIKLLF